MRIKKIKSYTKRDFQTREIIGEAKKLALFVKKEYNVSGVFLIGSIARGKWDDLSDIDMVVENLEESLFFRCSSQLNSMMRLRVHLMMKKDLPEKLKKELITKGIAL